MKKNFFYKIFVLIVSLLITYCFYIEQDKDKFVSYAMSNIPKYNGNDYIIIDNNIPKFSDELLNTKSFEEYSELDSLKRCGVAIANIDNSIMPKEKRDSIGMIKPSGWQTIKYDFIEGKYLYNRCHLIGYQLTGENANNKNLITCTRQMNTGTMLEYENKVANYIKKTHNHVLYRVTPYYENDNLLASGVQMEGLSIEDNGEGIKFNIYVYNVQDGVNINYKDGTSKVR
ncbi:MAG: hypothetical protein E7158_02955 [Firmicutes bacterium]|nr:hypothetical protein [Bacillota bacterium]